MDIDETAQNEIDHKKALKAARAKARRDKIKGEQDLGKRETRLETKARLKFEAKEQAEIDYKKELRKEKNVAAKEILERGHLGLPLTKKVGKMGKLSLAVLDRIAQLGFDPLEQSVNIARGTAFKEHHPFLQRFEMMLTEWIDTLGQFDELDLMEVERFKDDGIKALRDSFTPIDLRSKHTLELLTYLYPKRKAMEMSITTDRPEMVVTPLTDDEVEMFQAKFQERY